MITSVNTLNEIIDQFADPRVKEWNMMGSPLPSIIIVCTYLMAVYVALPTYMKNRKPLNLTSIIRYYNILQVVCCVALIYMTLSAGYLQGKYSWGCQPIDYSNDYYAVKLLNVFYWTYLIKMLELVETVFFILRKKFNQVSPLHVYHHASTFFLSWMGCKFLGGGMCSVPIIINSFIHVLMYSYYYLSSLGPEWKKKLAPWKPKLTMLQMIQFSILIVHALFALQPSCHVPKKVLLLYIPNIILIFKMFYDFFQNNYVIKNNMNSVQKAKKRVDKQ